jgi:hypothetical protein
VLVGAAEGAQGPGCEALHEGFLAEPVSAWSSLAFVVAAIVIVMSARGLVDTPEGPTNGNRRRAVLGYAALVAGIGVGSILQHGPNPPGSDVVHDLPLLGTLLFIAVDSAAALAGRRRVWWWWVLPTLALQPLVIGLPRAGDVAQFTIALLPVGLTLIRARATPGLRPRITVAVALMALGSVIGLSTRQGLLCVPDSIWQGHAAWHMLIAAGLAVLTPILGRPTRAPVYSSSPTTSSSSPTGSSSSPTASSSGSSTGSGSAARPAGTTGIVGGANRSGETSTATLLRDPSTSSRASTTSAGGRDVEANGR